MLLDMQAGKAIRGSGGEGRRLVIWVVRSACVERTQGFLQLPLNSQQVVTRAAWSVQQ